MKLKDTVPNEIIVWEELKFTISNLYRHREDWEELRGEIEKVDEIVERLRKLFGRRVTLLIETDNRPF